MGQWGCGSFLDLSNTSKFSKLGELMGCCVVIPFQMMEALATKIEERALDSVEDVAKRSTCFLCNNRLHSREGVRLNNDAGGCSSHEQE